MGAGVRLKIRIDAQGRSQNFELFQGKPFVIGRAAECDFRIDADSISQKHLELLWDGTVLRVKDLGSSNGTYRLPQDSPFLEANFSPRDRKLQLRLSKLPLVLSWEDPFESVEGFEKTEVLESASQPPEERDGFKSEAALDSADKTRVARLPSRELPPKSSPRAPLRPARTDELWAGPLFICGLAAALVQHLYFALKYSALLGLDRGLWPAGPAVDLYIFWWEELPFFSAVWALALSLAFVLKNRDLLFLPRPRSSVALVGALLFWCSVWGWPWKFQNSSAQPQELRAALAEFRALEEVVSAHNFADPKKNIAISSKLSDLSDPLKGSSVFYAFWHNFQKRRVIGECGGVGDEDWAKKRICLVLLYALSLDAYTSIRPIYLGPTASSLVFLSSLDGVIRVLAAEGPESENIKLFIASLDDAGLKKEATEFVSLVQGFRGQNFDELMRALMELRLSVEKKISGLQSGGNLPDRFSLNLMGPLEMGI